MTNKTLRAGCGRFILVMDAEAFIMKRRPNVSGMACRQVATDPGFNVACLAIRHLELFRHVLGDIVTLNAIDHLRQGKTGEVLALRNGVVASRTVRLNLSLFLKWAMCVNFRFT